MSFVTRIARHTIPKISRNQCRVFTNGVPRLSKKQIEITFVKHDGTQIKTKGDVGDHFLNVVIKNNINLDGYGACEGTLTCSTCHLIFKQEDYDKLPEEPEGEEVDMLELARDVTDTSRLGCQVCLTESMDGIVVRVPEVVNDLRLPSTS
ncbi:adrenodoxin [Zophobas morio]|uniref:adrenodoxin n=1 Tax=Zophobas morio TaxID=2755281 RepID=UPI0030839B52